MGNEQVCSHAEDSSPVGRGILVVSDLMIKNIDSWVCGGHSDCMQDELPTWHLVADFAHIASVAI